MSAATTIFDEADFNGFVDGRIEPSRAAALAESLAGDPDARARIDGWKRQNDSLRTLFASVLFEPVPVRLLPRTIDVEAPSARPYGLAPDARTTADAPFPAPGSRPLLGLSRGTIGWLVTTSVGMALAGFVAGALTSLGTDGFGFAPLTAQPSQTVAAESPTPERALAERAAETHQTYMADQTKPVEISAAEGPRLLHWLQTRLAAAIRIPDLQRQGWALVGGRVVPGQYGAAAFLVYGNGSDRLGLYIARTPVVQGEGVVVVEAGISRASIGVWSDQAFGYALTTSRPLAWLERNAGVLRDAIQAQIGDIPPAK